MRLPFHAAAAAFACCYLAGPMPPLPLGIMPRPRMPPAAMLAGTAAGRGGGRGNRSQGPSRKPVSGNKKVATGSPGKARGGSSNKKGKDSLEPKDKHLIYDEVEVIVRSGGGGHGAV